MTARTSRAVYEARNRVIVRLYRERDWLLAELAKAFEMSVANVHRILKAPGACLPVSDRRRRWRDANRAKARDPEIRAALSEAGLRAWQLGRCSGRRRLFEDAPELRAEYLQLQRKVGAAEARRIIAEGQAAQQLRMAA